MIEPHQPEEPTPEPWDTSASLRRAVADVEAGRVRPLPDLLSEAPTAPAEARVDLTLKGLPSSRARALLAVLGRLEDGDAWVPPPSLIEIDAITRAGFRLADLEALYRSGSDR